MYDETYEILKNHLRKGDKFTYIRKNNLLPFTTNKDQRVTFDNGSLPIIGAFSRLICDKKVKGINDENISEDILNNEYFEVERDEEYYAKLLVEEYLGKDQLNILHPKLFLYLPLSEGPAAGGEIKIAGFLKSIFFHNITLKDFYSESNSKFNSNILIDFIVDNLKELPDEKDLSEFYMPSSLIKVIEVFEEDINFLLNNHEEYLVKNFDKIISFYMFFYFIQFTLKSSSSVVSDELEKTFYLLDWETVSKNRKSVKFGYKNVSEYLKSLLTRIDGIEHVNILLGQNNLLPAEMVQYVEALPELDKKEFIKFFKLWIDYLRSVEGLDTQRLPEDFNELLYFYFKTIEESYKTKKSRHGPVSRYPKPIEDLGRKYFLKRRGRYGYMFNMNQEMLILITALCIKEEKIKVTQLFEEYERRGLFFDRDSLDNIVDLFNKLNLIDKKSDSGDIQYVKSIL